MTPRSGRVCTPVGPKGESMRSRPKGPQQFLWALAAGYALGNVPSADLAASLAGPPSNGDGTLRDIGSGNPGALNVGKELGKGWGAGVLVADIAKGWAAAVVGRKLGGPTCANIASAAAVVGHCYPATGKTGGKGVSTSIGQVLGTFPYYLPLDAAVALGTAALPRWTQRTWAGTAVASGVWVASSTLAWRRGWSTGTDHPAPGALPLAALFSSAVIARRFLDSPLVDGRPEEGEVDHDNTMEEREAKSL